MSLKAVQNIARISGRLLLIVFGMGVLVVTIAWLSGMFVDKTEPGRTEQVVRQIEDEPTDFVHEVQKTVVEEAIGTLKASSRTSVSAKLMATIESINVTAGDQVVVGQELVRLDGKEIQARLDQAKQNLQSAMANRELAQQQFDRIDNLYQQGAASRADFDRASRDLQVAIAEVTRTEEVVREVETQLSYTTITATKGGRIVDRFAEPGDIAQPGEPILALYDADSLRLEVPVMENLAVKLRVGDELTVYIDAIEREYKATIGEIVPQADAPSRSFLVKAILPKSEDLYEGMFGRLRIPAGERRHLCLATDAIVSIGQLEFVDVVLENGNVERRLIKTGQLGMPGRQEVLSGLEAGERVILHQEDLNPEAQDDDENR